MRRGRLRLAFFDLDDTVYDRTELRPEVLIAKLRLSPFEEWSRERISAAFGFLQEVGDFLQILGLPHPRHEPEHPAVLACCQFLFGEGAPAGQGSVRDGGSRGILLEALQTLSRACVPRPPVEWRAAASQAVQIRKVLLGDSGISAATEAIWGLSKEPIYRELAAEVVAGQRWEPYEPFLATWKLLQEEGIECFITTEGVDSVQMEKLSRLDLPQGLRGRLMSTSRAANPTGSASLRSMVEDLLKEAAVRSKGGASTASPAVDLLGPTLLAGIRSSYPLVWVLDQAGRKSPFFFARAIEAAVVGGGTAAEALDELQFLSAAAWGENPVTLAVVGDNPLTDMEPVVGLLGEGFAWTGLLQLGKHWNNKETRGGAPTSVFGDWTELSDHLTGRVRWDSLVPLDGPPRQKAFPPDMISDISDSVDPTLPLAGALIRFLSAPGGSIDPGPFVRP